MADTIESLVVVIDPEDRSRLGLIQEVQQAGFGTRAYAAPDGFLRDLSNLEKPTCFCLVSELRFAAMSAFELLERLGTTPHIWSAIVCVRSATIRDVVRAMRLGAIGVVEKDDTKGSLLSYIEEGVEQSRSRFLTERNRYAAMEQLNQLTSGEQQVLRGIMLGKLNKEIAQELQLSIRTIEQRRREVFRKLNVQHPASLACKIMEIAGSSPATTGNEAAPISWLDEARRRSETLNHRPHSRLDGAHNA